MTSQKYPNPSTSNYVIQRLLKLAKIAPKSALIGHISGWAAKDGLTPCHWSTIAGQGSPKPILGRSYRFSRLGNETDGYLKINMPSNYSVDSRYRCRSENRRFHPVDLVFTKPTKTRANTRANTPPAARWVKWPLVTTRR